MSEFSIRNIVITLALQVSLGPVVFGALDAVAAPLGPMKFPAVGNVNLPIQPVQDNCPPGKICIHRPPHLGPVIHPPKPPHQPWPPNPDNDWKQHHHQRPPGPHHIHPRDFVPFTFFEPDFYYPDDDYYYYPNRPLSDEFSCSEARSVLRHWGYKYVKSYDCAAPVYGFHAMKGKIKYDIQFGARTGKIISISRN